jgi:hypothetical protein
MRGETAGGAGHPSGHGDQVSPDGGGGRAGVESAGEAAGGAGEVVRDAHNTAQERWRRTIRSADAASALAAASAMTCSITA